jgi:protein-tyrosine phosphatase
MGGSDGRRAVRTGRVAGSLASHSILPDGSPRVRHSWSEASSTGVSGVGGALPTRQDGAVAVPERLVALEGAFNFRDLGGYPSRDGRSTRWGRLFRSDTLHELTAEDVEILRGLGLVTVVDLRTPRELARTGRGRLEPEKIDFHHLSVLGDAAPAMGESTNREGGGAGEGGDGRRDDGQPEGEDPGEAIAAPAPVGEDLSARYRWYLDVGRESLAAALQLIGDPARLPLVFHCAAGKDRTGVLAALVLDLVGVDHNDIVEDYLITAGRMELILGRFRSDPTLAERLARVPPATYGVEAVTMRSFLEGLHLEFGGARAWATDAGVPTTILDRIPELLLGS